MKDGTNAFTDSGRTNCKRVIGRAIAWATSSSVDGTNNYEAFVSELNRIRVSMSPDDARLYDRGTNGCVTQGNPVSALRGRLERDRGMAPEIWPVLVRVALVDYPQLSRVVAPSKDVHLDSQHGSAQVQLAARSITGRRPQVHRWEMAC